MKRYRLQYVPPESLWQKTPRAVDYTAANFIHRTRHQEFHAQKTDHVTFLTQQTRGGESNNFCALSIHDPLPLLREGFLIPPLQN